MKNFIVFSLVLLSFTAFCQSKSVNILKSGVVIKSTPVPLLFESLIGGTINIESNSLMFKVNPCAESSKKISFLFPCNNHLIKNITINFSNIDKIKRRNYLLIIPNRLAIKLKNGERFLFTTYRRKAVISAFKTYKKQEASTEIDSPRKAFVTQGL